MLPLPVTRWPLRIYESAERAGEERLGFPIKPVRKLQFQNRLLCHLFGNVVSEQVYCAAQLTISRMTGLLAGGRRLVTRYTTAEDAKSAKSTESARTPSCACPLTSAASGDDAK